MIEWKDVLVLATHGNLKPDRRVEKTDAEWQSLLTPEQFRVTRLKGTERPFSSEMCQLFEAGRYGCICCDTLLFDATEKYDSRSGWPSFTQPIQPNAISYHNDLSLASPRVEVTCSTCDSHLGHVFPDGPEPSGLRYCINALSMKKVKDEAPSTTTKLATFGGGCFWCTEAFFQQLRGVKSVMSGYSGGAIEKPSYEQVCTGATGHAEVVQIEYDPAQISYADLLRVHFGTHDPTTLNQQGADRGTQYRSIIFFRDEEEKKVAEEQAAEAASLFSDPVVTALESFTVFYPAESNHQDYYLANPDAGYCRAVIDPKVGGFRQRFSDLLASTSD